MGIEKVFIYINLNDSFRQKSYGYSLEEKLRVWDEEKVDLHNYLGKLGEDDITVEGFKFSQNDPYSYTVLSGVPTVINYVFQEYIIRGHTLDEQRITDVKNIYTSTDEGLVKDLIKKYNVKYVLVTEYEIEKYKLNDKSAFIRLSNIEYQGEKSRVYKIN